MQTFASKMVSVKVDFSTQRKGYFIGMNLQAVMGSNLRVIIAAVSELHKRATAAAIRKNIADCLAKLGILKKQIYSLTTDYGSKVLKVGS